MRVAVFTDSIDDVNGVAIGLRRLAEACRRASLPLALVGAGDGDAIAVDQDGVVRLPTHFHRSLAFYPEMSWGVPRVRPLARWLDDARIDVVGCATPGPIGIAALAAARARGLPVVSQYHTEVPDSAARMTGNAAFGAFAERVVSWFYRKADLCLAPSRSAVARLLDYGVERIALVPRGVDLALFRPERRDRAALARFGLADRPVVLYVGRLSREKNLGALLDAFALVRAARPDAALLLVGDGPIARELDAPGVVRAGTLLGEELARVIASADVFAFPSETETFGNAVVEAQAAGLPVVVASAGAVHEHVIDGTTAIVVDASRPGEIAGAIGALLDDPARASRMGRAAHLFAQRYDLDAAARATFAIYREVQCAARS